MSDMEKKPRVYDANIEDLKQLPNNPNAGTERGQYMLEESMETGGVGRPIFVAADNTILGGNHTAEVFGQKFEDGRVVIVETTGDTLIVNKRIDIPNAEDPRARQLIIADNRTSEIGLEWDANILADYSPSELEKWFKDFEIDEISKLLDYSIGVIAEPASKNKDIDYHVCPNCGFKIQDHE